ncbi:MAG: mobile element hypothetical protein [Bacteroidetes bacterium HLUCCA01]|nr:MAG: mobile element hypothetical protein [Bacteroidetes bacterium HLUCCA01]
MARLRRTRKPLTLDELRASMSTALIELERIYTDTKKDADSRIRAINSLATLANSYARITEVSDIEKRLTELETANAYSKAG